MTNFAKILLSINHQIRNRSAFNQEWINPFGSICYVDGTGAFTTRQMENVLEAICHGDVSIGILFDWHRAHHLLLHRCGDLSSNQVEHSESVDATYGGWLHDA